MLLPQALPLAQEKMGPLEDFPSWVAHSVDMSAPTEEARLDPPLVGQGESQANANPESLAAARRTETLRMANSRRKIRLES